MARMRSALTGRYVSSRDVNKVSFKLDGSKEIRVMAAHMLLVEPLMNVTTARRLRSEGKKLVAAVRAHASGRPGPNIITKAHWHSISAQYDFKAGSAAVIVGSDSPQARRLEFGFMNMTDSLGRTYRQPPYPHFGPALDQRKGPFENEALAAVRWATRNL